MCHSHILNRIRQWRLHNFRFAPIFFSGCRSIVRSRRKKMNSHLTSSDDLMKTHSYWNLKQTKCLAVYLHVSSFSHLLSSHSVTIRMFLRFNWSEKLAKIIKNQELSAEIRHETVDLYFSKSASRSFSFHLPLNLDTLLIISLALFDYSLELSDSDKTRANRYNSRKSLITFRRNAICLFYTLITLLNVLTQKLAYFSTQTQQNCDVWNLLTLKRFWILVLGHKNFIFLSLNGIELENLKQCITCAVMMIQKICLKINRCLFVCGMFTFIWCDQFLETIVIAIQIDACENVRAMFIDSSLRKILFVCKMCTFNRLNLFRGETLALHFVRSVIRWTVRMKPIIHIANKFSFVLVCFRDVGLFFWYWTLLSQFEVRRSHKSFSNSTESHRRRVHSPSMHRKIENDVNLCNFCNYRNWIGQCISKYVRVLRTSTCLFEKNRTLKQCLWSVWLDSFPAIFNQS